tara:strand:+ start:44 stop:625 length:582 start_codon:yes stop_codon:yes gene_type:complete
MVATNFWTSPNKDPKRAYRFIVDLASGEGVTGFVNGATWYASKADKPKFSVTETAHKYINHTFHYPGRVEWENVTITLVDPTEPSAAAATAEILEKSGYQIPGSAAAAEATTTINKSDATNALGNVTITQIGENPTDELEKWTLRNAWIQQANFSQLDYESDELSTIELVIRYDWAELQTVSGQSTDNFFRKV